MRSRLASLLRWLADYLHPEHEIVVHIRPVLVGEQGMQQTLRILTHLEQERLGIHELAQRR
jgi:hypothetical protein